jgi:hypothetical protein
MRQLVVEKVNEGGLRRSRLSTFLDPPSAYVDQADLAESELARLFQHFRLFEPIGGLSQHLLLKVPFYAHLFPSSNTAAGT